MRYQTQKAIAESDAFGRLYRDREAYKARCDALEATMLVMAIERTWLMKACEVTQRELTEALERDGVTFPNRAAIEKVARADR